MLLATIVTHFSSDDPQQAEDYTSVSIKAPNLPVQRFGSAEHNGKVRAEGFVDALRLIFPNMKFERRSISDGPSSRW